MHTRKSNIRLIKAESHEDFVKDVKSSGVPVTMAESHEDFVRESKKKSGRPSTSEYARIMKLYEGEGFPKAQAGRIARATIKLHKKGVKT